jgi:hypothetical protein
MLAIVIASGQEILPFEHSFNYRNGNLLEAFALFLHESFSVITP